MTAEKPQEQRKFTTDRFLGGRVEAVQPDDGSHRSGLEAVLLGAAVPAGFSGTIVDMGAGCGVAGLCAAARAEHARVLLAERNEGALVAARATLNLPANAGLAARTQLIEADILAPEGERVAAGLARNMAEAIITNPPFNDGGRGTASPAPGRASAHIIPDGALERWIRTAASVLKPRGELVIIYRAEGLSELLAAIAGRFGALRVLPIHPRAGRPAHRIMLRGIKGSRGALTLLPPLVLHGATGNAYLPEMDSVLRDGAGLADVHSAWGER